MKKFIPEWLWRFFTHKCKKHNQSLVDWRGVSVCEKCDLG